MSIFSDGPKTPIHPRINNKTMISYITSLYAVRDDYLPILYEQFQELDRICTPLYVWTDRPLPFSCRAHVLVAPLESFASYMLCQSPVSLPARRSPAKDTQAFLALMNTKVEMVWRAAPFIHTTHVAWIDAGILKIVKDKERVAVALARHADVLWPQKVALPGCWTTRIVDLYQEVCWRFCGGFFVVPTSLLALLYDKVMRLLTAWIAAGHLAWEVNVWADLEEKEPTLFAWWPADHNESMFEPKLGTDQPNTIS